MIGPDASAFGFAVSSSSSVGDEQDLLEQLVDPLALLRGDARDLRRPAPLLGLEPLGRELAEHAVGVRVRQVDLVDGDDDRHVGRARVRDRLARLRHDAVVGRDDEHGDVGDLRAAGAHRGERLVAGRVEEGDLPAVDLGLVGADVLRDAAGLGLDDRGLADRVEQRRLAVVDVAHDRDDRRAGLERSSGVVVRLRLGLLLARVLDRDLALELGRDQLDLVVGERLRRGLHLAEAHQHLDDLRHRDAERLREVADGDARLDGDRPGRRRRPRAASWARGRRDGRRAAGAGRSPAAAAAALDDDAALPVARPAAASGSDWSSAWHGPQSHASSVEPRERRVDEDGLTQDVRLKLRWRASRARSTRGGGRCRRPARPLPRPRGCLASAWNR